MSWVKLPSNVTLLSLSGTIWSGKARQVRVSGIELGSMSWDVHPFNFLMGELSIDVWIKNNNQYIQSKIIMASSGKVTLEDTKFKIKLALLAPLTYGMPVSYNGTASGYFPISFFLKNNYVGINGKLSLSGIELISPQRQYFGDFTVDFRTEKAGASSGKIKDVAGELLVNGAITINKNGLLNLSAKIAARETGSSIDQMLPFFGKKDEGGRIQLNNNFQLWR